MRCAWQAYINLLLHWMRQEVDKQGSTKLQELRMRIGLEPEMIFQQECCSLSAKVQMDDIRFVINAASEYSPWAARSVAQGYLTASGGHRIGICGVSTTSNGKMFDISQPTSIDYRPTRQWQNDSASGFNSCKVQ